MEYDEAIDFLLNGGGEIKPGLARISDLIEKLLNPHTGMKIVHIAGTNGKGSVATFISAVLEEAGFVTGCFNSPWITKVNNCICVNGEIISNQELCNIVQEMLPCSTEATQFEKLTALAFCHFRNMNCEFVVLEAGMGGQCDATNFISTSLVSVITKISMDHQQFLGETLEKIAKHKAGIIKTGGKVFVAPQNFVVMAEITKVCKEKNAALTLLNLNDIFIEKISIEGTKFKFDTDMDFEIGMIGTHQVENCCLAILVLREILGSQKEFLGLKNLEEIEEIEEIKEREEFIRNGIKRASWPGRFEVICHEPWIVVDGAHNVDGMNSLLNGLKKFFPERKLVFLIGILKDKEVEKLIQMISKYANKIVAVTPTNHRALKSLELVEIALNHCANVWDGGTIKNAMRIVIEDVGKEDVIVACGSLFIIDEVKIEVSKYAL